MLENEFLFTSESVTARHRDEVADRISAGLGATVGA
jgi:S-adenosylmethionine synthetase